MSNAPGGGPSSNTPVMGQVVTPAPQVEPAGTNAMGPPPGRPSPSEEPPNKKPKLKLTVRDPTASMSPASAPAGPVSGPTPSPAPNGDTIAVARPRRNSALRIRYSENMVLEDESLRLNEPDSDSDLSSLESTPPPAPQPEVMEQRRKSANKDYGDLMSYYIMGGDEDEPQAAPPKSPPKPKHQAPAPRLQHQHQHQQRPPQQQQQHQQQQMPMQPPRDQAFRPHGPPQPYPPVHHRPPPPPPPPPPMPQVQLIDFDEVSKRDAPKEPATVLAMVKKLEALSHALTNFGGVPTVPKSPKTESMSCRPHPAIKLMTKTCADAVPPAAPPQQEKKKDNPLDSFLGMFDDDDERDSSELKEPKEPKESKEREKSKEPEKPKDDPAKRLDHVLQTPGQSDGPLTYGIQFIQNALKSWAQQRLQHQYAPQLLEQGRQWQQQQLANQKRGPGRPRKFHDGDEPDRHHIPSQPPPFQIRQESTPEGVAIKAFQQVLDSGCLQVNALMPQELTSALRHLYMQIDHLINQGAKNEPQWQCMSYGAQIAANKARVDKWKDAHAKAQEEMARQHQLAHQTMMQQMGMAATPQEGHMTPAQAQQAHAIELERKRSIHHAAQQPQISQNLLNPMQFGNQQQGLPTGTPANANQTGSPAPAQNGFPNQPSPANGNGARSIQSMKMYTADLTPRTGAQMKFSFPPNNDKAVKAFGVQAFPNAGSPAGNTPNRGHMTATPVQQTPILGLDGPADSPVVRPSIEGPPNQANGQAHQANGEVTEDAEKRAENEMRDVEMVEDDTVSVKKEAPTPAPVQIGGFTAVNAPQRPISVSAGSPETAPRKSKRKASELPALGSSAKTVSRINGEGKGTDLASRYPHPGAVVLDQ